ncbi:MAG: NAD(P)H-dependent oxidoreductase subunit E [Candidatus Promineifilaceae bacterium]
MSAGLSKMLSETRLPPDLDAIEVIAAGYEGRGREALLPLLHELQAVAGWLPREAQQVAGATLRVPLADVHGVVEFYSLFYNRPTARRVVRLCTDPACSLAGAADVDIALQKALGVAAGETSADGRISYEHMTCLGMCELAPAGLNGERPAGHLSAEGAPAFLAGALPEPEALVYGEPRWLTARVGTGAHASLESYLAQGGYLGLRRALEMSPDALIEQIEASGILGRGGATFPLGRKWRLTRAAAGANKHIVVNADESEPGTFKDRVLLEEDPFAVVEAASLAAYAVGAERGWVFVRGEYPRAFARVAEAVRQARAAGLLGRNILGRAGFNFDIEMRLGAGAYICGEETALFEAIEGRRGFPRIKPPFPVTHGLFQQPTAINNVETLLAALAYVNLGPEAWRKVGTADSPGSKLFCVSGHVGRPGLYEVPFGLTVADLLARAGGVPSGRKLQALLLGGAAGILAGPEMLDLPLSCEVARARNVPLGSGVIMAFDEAVDLRQVLYQLGRFFAHESCGKCFPCQLGTQRQLELLGDLAHNGGFRASDAQSLADVGYTMTQTSLCGLGQTAASAVISAMRRWPEMFA